ncbi:MAG: thrombospondin type 3 repeat-containing protein, partial [Sediminibacterium sp.]|nr:thrombospondin type 3 repeat-containing protein [Sediminibacterium sp.]
MKTIARVVLCISIISFSSTPSRAQTEKYHFEAGINLGTLLYQGDLVESPLGSFKGAKPMINIWIAKPFTSYFSWRANLTVGSLSADESQFAAPSWKQTRNFAFSTPLTELSGLLQFNLNGDNGQASYHALTPYLLAGAGATFF